MGRPRRRRLIPAVQLAWLVAFLAAAIVAAVRCDWTGLSIALLWAFLDAVSIQVALLQEKLEEKPEKPE